MWRVMSALSPRIAEGHPSPRRHAVGDVEELPRRDRVEVLEHGLLEQFGVHGRHAVDRVAPDRREMRHADVSAAAFVHDRQALDEPFVPGMPQANGIEEAPVDLVDDFEVAREEAAEQRQRPLLEGLGEQRVVRVRACLLGDSPRRLPVHPVLVHQQPHQLGDGEGGVRVVQLHGPPPVEVVEPAALQQVDANHVLQRARDEEILLLQSQLLAGLRLVVRVEHLRDRLRRHLLVDRHRSSRRG